MCDTLVYVIKINRIGVYSYVLSRHLCHALLLCLHTVDNVHFLEQLKSGHIPRIVPLKNSHLMWAFSFLSADSTPWSLRTSWYAHRSSSSRRSLYLMASSSCPSREERISFSSLRRGSLMSRLLAALLAPSPPATLLCPLILRVGTSFPCMSVMEVAG